MKPRYRFKGKFSNKERKVVIEYEQDGKLKTFTLPKAGTLKNVLEKLNNSKGETGRRKLCTLRTQSEGIILK